MELKPCPFCGGKPKIYDNSDDFNATEKLYGIRCTKCGLHVHGVGNLIRSKQQTISRWNRRDEERKRENDR